MAKIMCRGRPVSWKCRIRDLHVVIWSEPRILINGRVHKQKLVKKKGCLGDRFDMHLELQRGTW